MTDRIFIFNAMELTRPCLAMSDSGLDNQFVPQQGVEQLFGGMPELAYDSNHSGSAYDLNVAREGDDTLDSFLKWN
jgi:hypothetical protein